MSTGKSRKSPSHAFLTRIKKQCACPANAVPCRRSSTVLSAPNSVEANVFMSASVVTPDGQVSKEEDAPFAKELLVRRSFCSGSAIENCSRNRQQGQPDPLTGQRPRSRHHTIHWSRQHTIQRARSNAQSETSQSSETAEAHTATEMRTSRGARTPGWGTEPTPLSRKNSRLDDKDDDHDHDHKDDECICIVFFNSFCFKFMLAVYLEENRQP